MIKNKPAINPHKIKAAAKTLSQADREKVSSQGERLAKNKLVEKITDPIVKNYWTKQITQTSDFHKSEVLDYIVSKFSRFVSDKRLRNIVCQSDDTVNFQQLIQDKKTILLDFSEYYYDKEANRIISSLLFSKLLTLFRNIRITSKVQISLYIDEVGLWNPQVIIDLMRYSGLYNLAITILSSRAKQINSLLKYEVLRSGTIVMFRSIKDDIEDISQVIGIDIKTISELKKFHAILKTLENGSITEIKKINTTKENNQENTVNLLESIGLTIPANVIQSRLKNNVIILMEKAL